MGMRGRYWRLAAVAALAGALIFPSQASSSETYEIPAIAQWTKATLTTVIVPPNHGQILNEDTGLLNEGDPMEVTPFNSYVGAIEAGIAQWETGIDAFGADWLKEAYDVRAYVLGRDSIPPAVLAQPDILVVTDEGQATSLGTAFRVIPCVVRLSKFEIESFSWADMYNVSSHEFGHCLGLQHVGDQGGVDPLADQQEPEHDVMNGFYTHFIGAAGTHLHCVSNLDVLGLEFVFSHPNPSPLPTAGEHATISLASDRYGDTCSPPPPDWRATPKPTPTQTPTPMPYQTPYPMASPSASRSPASTPTPTPESNPSPEPSSTPKSSPTPKSSATAPSPSPVPSATSTPVVQAPSSAITQPSAGDVLSRRAFKKVTGTATGSGAPSISVAFARRVASGCAWWDAASRGFTSGSCTSPLWNDARGASSWSFRIPKKLPAGRYKVFARAASAGIYEACCDMGRNLVDFRLTAR